MDQTLQKTHIPCNKKSSNLESGQFTSNFMNSTMFLATLLWSKQPLPAPYRRVLPRQPPGPDSMVFPWASQKGPMLRIHEDYVSKDRLGYIHTLYMYVCIIMYVCTYIYIYHFLCVIIWRIHAGATWSLLGSGSPIWQDFSDYISIQNIDTRTFSIWTYPGQMDIQTPDFYPSCNGPFEGFCGSKFLVSISSQGKSV